MVVIKVRFNMEWISVSDRLPEEGIDVFLRTSRAPCGEQSNLIGYFGSGNKFKIACCNPDACYKGIPDCADLKITHWMAIPLLVGDSN